MKRRIAGQVIFGVLCCGSLVVAAYLFSNLGDLSFSESGVATVIQSQRLALERMEESLPITFKADDEGRVIQLVARGPQMTDAVAAQLADLPDLRDVQVEGSTLGAEGIGAIASLPHLESLRLENSQLADESLLELAAAEHLRQLFLGECPIGDGALPSMGQLSKLELLDLNRTEVTDEGLQSLSGLNSLKKLYLAETVVTGAGFSTFSETHPLALLNLSGCPVTAEGIEELKRFTSLQSLYLDGVQLDDALVAQLMDVTTQATPKLEGLFMSQTPLTDSAIEPLKALANLPNLTLVGLNDTRISKAAFRELAAVTPEARYLVDYEPGGD